MPHDPLQALEASLLVLISSGRRTCLPQRRWIRLRSRSASPAAVRSWWRRWGVSIPGVADHHTARWEPLVELTACDVDAIGGPGHLRID